MEYAAVISDFNQEAYMNGIDSLEEYRDNKNMILKRKEEISEKIESIKIISLSDQEIRQQFLDNVRTALDIIESDEDFEKKSSAIRSIVKYITFYKSTKTLVFHYFIAV